MRSSGTRSPERQRAARPAPSPPGSAGHGGAATSRVSRARKNEKKNHPRRSGRMTDPGAIEATFASIEARAKRVLFAYLTNVSQRERPPPGNGKTSAGALGEPHPHVTAREAEFARKVLQIVEPLARAERKSRPARAGTDLGGLFGDEARQHERPAIPAGTVESRCGTTRVPRDSDGQETTTGSVPSAGRRRGCRSGPPGELR